MNQLQLGLLEISDKDEKQRLEKELDLKMKIAASMAVRIMTVYMCIMVVELFCGRKGLPKLYHRNIKAIKVAVYIFYDYNHKLEREKKKFAHKICHHQEQGMN